MNHFQHLEAESIEILREAATRTFKPVMLYSISKDSSVMLHLARKAFHTAAPPFQLLDVDTTFKFQAMYAHREGMSQESGMELTFNNGCRDTGFFDLRRASNINW